MWRKSIPPVCENMYIFVMLGYWAYTQSPGWQSPLPFSLCLCFYVLWRKARAGHAFMKCKLVTIGETSKFSIVFFRKQDLNWCYGCSIRKLWNKNNESCKISPSKKLTHAFQNSFSWLMIFFNYSYQTRVRRKPICNEWQPRM